MSLVVDYQPIACVVHEKLEFAVLTRRRLQICYRDPAGLEIAATVLPVDVYSANAAEWLTMQYACGRRETLRLDAILSFVELV